VLWSTTTAAKKRQLAAIAMERTEDAKDDFIVARYLFIYCVLVPLDFWLFGFCEMRENHQVTH
jgi:hypothetical protein